MKAIKVRTISMDRKVEDRTHCAPRGIDFTPRGISDVLEGTGRALRRKHPGVKYAVARISETEFLFAPTCVMNDRTPGLEKVEAPATAQDIKTVSVRVVAPHDGREQRREFPAPEGKCFERSGIKRVLDAVVEWCKKEYPLTNFVVFEEGAGEFAFVPEQAVDKKALKRALSAAMN